MRTEQTFSDNEDLECCVEREINRRTWGHIRQLHVRVVADRLIVEGSTSSYYLKQQALTAVLNALQSTGLRPEVRIAVQVDRGAVARTSGGSDMRRRLVMTPLPRTRSSEHAPAPLPEGGTAQRPAKLDGPPASASD